MEVSLLRLLENTRRIGTWTVDVERSLCKWSPVTYEIHELDPGPEIRLEEAIQYFVPEHQPIFERCVEEAISQRKPWSLELQIRTARGNVRWVLAAGEPFFDGETLVRLHGMFEDIDERKSQEVERELTLRRMHEGERVAKLGYWWWNVSTNKVEWSPGCSRMFEISNEASTVTLEEHAQWLHPEDLGPFQERLHQAREDHQAFQMDFRLLLGDRVKHLHGEGFPQEDSQGKLISFFGLVLDRTATERGKHTIEELNRRLNLALNASEIGVWEWNIQTNELIWDEPMIALYGLEPDTFSGAYSAWETGLHPEDRDEAVETIQHAVESGGRFETTFRIVWPDGTIRWIRGMADQVMDAAGEPERLIGLNWDITDSVHAQAELKRSNEELAQFAYRTSHDLKSPVTSIRRMAEYLREDAQSGDLAAVHEGAARIESLAESAEAMVMGILDAAKADLVDVPNEPVALDALVKEVLERHQSLASDPSRARPVELRSKVQVQNSLIVPRVRIEQAISNLVANGVIYADPEREQPFVCVYAEQQGKRLLMRVEDNGVGLSSPDPDAPFEMFRRFHSDIAGTGLGLYIVKKHLDALGGSIRFESSREGTVFHLEIPLTV